MICVHLYRESLQTSELRRGFLEAIQQWLKRPASYNGKVTTLLPSNQQLQQSDATVKEPIELKHKDKTSITTLPLPSKYVKFDVCKI